MGTDDEKKEVESSTDVSDLEKKIIRQVEYYFGNYNLNKDKFLKEQITLDDGWVPLDTLIKFNRLKLLSEDFKVICDALKKSSSGLLEVDVESTKIRRSVDKPLPDEATTRDEIWNRSLYVKGFKRTTTLDELLEFFKDHKAENISMRYMKPPKKGFKGSSFVTFETLEDAEKFLGLKGIKFQGTELLKEKKKDYMKRKDEQYANFRKEKENRKQQRAEAMKKDGGVPEIKMVPGCLLKLTGLSSDTIREDLKAPLEKYGNVVYVDYSKGKPEGVVRFETGVAKDALEGLSTEEDGVKKIEFKGVKATATLLEGDEEEEYWKNIAISRASRYSEHQKQNKGKFGKRQNWNKNRREKRNYRNEENDGPPSKRVKTEETSEESKATNNGDKQEAVKRGHANEDNEPPSKKVKKAESSEVKDTDNGSEPGPVKTEPAKEVTAN